MTKKSENYQSQYEISDETRQIKKNFIYQDTERNKHSQKILQEKKEIKGSLNI